MAHQRDLEAAKAGDRLSSAIGQVNGLCSLFYLVVIAFPDVLEEIAHLMHPVALMASPGTHGLNRRRRSGTAPRGQGKNRGQSSNNTDPTPRQTLY
ncbi:MAG: hypothetical protein JO356_21630 [Acidobacteria bacterium]|nr:hypothetical protein [Acidobacteriota bacterium]